MAGDIAKKKILLYGKEILQIYDFNKAIDIINFTKQFQNFIDKTMI